MPSPIRTALLLGVLLVSCKKSNDDAPRTASLKHEVGGFAPQGGLVDFAVANLDTANPFSGAAPVLLSGGIVIRYTEVSSARLTGIALVDPLAPIGPLRLELSAQNSRGEQVTFFSAPDDPMAPLISLASSPLRLAPDIAAPNEAIAAPRQVNLYKVAVPAENQIVLLSFGTVGASLRTTSGSRLVGAMAPTSGKFAEGMTFETTFDSLAGSSTGVGFAPLAGEAYVAIYTSDLSGGPSEYNYSLRAAFANGTKFSMAEPKVPDAPATPLAAIELDGPAYAVDGAIDNRDDADYVLFTVKTPGRVFVQATPIGGGGPLNVSLFGNDPGTASCTAYVGGGLGTTQAELRAIADTTYCARVNSTTPLTMKYRLVVTPEAR